MLPRPLSGPASVRALILTLATMASPDHGPGPYRGQPNCRGLRADRGQFLQQPDALPFVEKYQGRAGRGPARFAQV